LKNESKKVLSSIAIFSSYTNQIKGEKGKTCKSGTKINSSLSKETIADTL